MTKTLTAGGDSQTAYDAGFGVRPSQTWAAQTARMLAGDWRGRAFGISGHTSAQLLARADVYVQYDVPDVALHAIGVNDPGAISTAQTQTNVEAMILALKHGAVGRGAGLGTGVTVANPAALPANGRAGERYVVLADDSTTGGITPVVAGAVAADANGQKFSVWENRNPLAGVFGWGRVAVPATAPTVVKRHVVVSPPYRNFTAGGDTPTTPVAANVGVRTALAAAVAGQNVVVGGKPSVIYCDLYAFMRARIVAGTDLDFSAVAYSQARSWHYIQNNQHYSAYGHHLQAVKAAADISAAWPELLV